MTAPAAGGDASKSRGIAYKDKSKPADVRSSNINAAKGKHFNCIFCLPCLVIHEGLQGFANFSVFTMQLYYCNKIVFLIMYSKNALNLQLSVMQFVQVWGQEEWIKWLVLYHFPRSVLFHILLFLDPSRKW